MLYKGSKRVSRLYVGSTAIAALYMGAQKIWEAVCSCFGSGFWVNLKPWSDKECWKNH